MPKGKNFDFSKVKIPKDLLYSLRANDPIVYSYETKAIFDAVNLNDMPNLFEKTPREEFIEQIIQNSERMQLAEFQKELPMLGTEEIENRVGFHKATIEGPEATLPRHAYLRNLFKQIMTELDDILPDSRAKSVAMTHLEDCSMWSHKAVAEKAPLVPDSVDVDTPVLEKIDEEQKLKDILERLLVDHWSSLTDRHPGESNKGFLTRMNQARFISDKDFNAIYQ